MLIAGGGVAALETSLALDDLAPGQTDVTVLAPNEDFVYSPMTDSRTVLLWPARSYPLVPILRDACATLLATSSTGSTLEADDRTSRHGTGDRAYDALVLALGAKIVPARFEQALTIDDRRMEETLHGLIQDVEGVTCTASLSSHPARMPWPLPLYELAMMTAGRAYDTASIWR